MILAERLCLFGFDPQSGRERDAPERDALKTAVAGLMLADLLGVGRFVADADHLLPQDRLPLAHPLLRDAAERLGGSRTRTPKEAMHELRPLALRWWRRMHGTLAARDVLEAQTILEMHRKLSGRSPITLTRLNSDLHYVRKFGVVKLNCGFIALKDKKYAAKWVKLPAVKSGILHNYFKKIKTKGIFYALAK